ncbi:type II toxin-antitoxin system RelE/ParE family toxin [Pseudomonas nitroreducens]|uniref:type II toxin-antitoxin system RelE/ParE family toxin n=1 Tax=Pseudomonas nitroreducens TaxID=46680 RepID=UPI0026589F63|nr:type II toxin-antitoxin system RelE/ParE family toxin [Pseudomonas nitroreducens]MCP1648492.1 plasmid stabilization system protein ParE [Pseudomonas nitroreducens]MCP1687066.1 plasmid stabilization system protein ParE [Pseudomonas nitroreducens]
MSLQWTHKAAADLDAIYDHYVVLIGPEKALRAIQDIVEQVSPLANLEQSSSGAPSEVPGVRELAVERWPYQAAFRVKDRSVQILRIDRVDNSG